MTHQFTNEEIYEYVKCRDDFAYFAEKYVRLPATQGNDEGKFIFNDGMSKILFDLKETGIHENLSHWRQVGKSTFGILWILHKAIFEIDKTATIFARDGSRHLRDILDFIYHNLPEFLKGKLHTNNRTELRVNNSRILFKSTYDSMRGMTINYLFIDEYNYLTARQKKEFEYILPIFMATKREVLILST